MSSREIVGKLKALRPLLEREGVRHLVLFGSQARGTAAPGSDVDIAIEVMPDSRFSLLDLVGVEHIVSDAVGIPANAFMHRSLDSAFRGEIDRDGIRVF